MHNQRQHEAVEDLLHFPLWQSLRRLPPGRIDAGQHRVGYFQLFVTVLLAPPVLCIEPVDDLVNAGKDDDLLAVCGSAE